jgi:hypothetical protein
MVDAYIDVPLRNKDQTESVSWSHSTDLVPSMSNSTFCYSVRYIEMGHVRLSHGPTVISLT